MATSKKEYIAMTQAVQLGEPLPKGYVPYRAVREFLEREANTAKRTYLVDHAGIAGIGWRLGPVHFEMYIGDTEPKIETGGPLRRIHWQPVTVLERPQGWGRSWLDFRVRLTGFAEIPADPAQPYDHNWNDHARRHRKKWRKEKGVEWELVTPTYDEFATAYKKSKKDATLKYLFLSQLQDKLRVHGDRVRLFAIRKKLPNAASALKPEPLEAGFACIDIPEARSSLHFISFILDSARKSPIGVGLMDEWFETSRMLGIRFLDFGIFWAAGDPPAWMGFSQFKSQFGIRLIRYPLALARWMGKWGGK